MKWREVLGLVLCICGIVLLWNGKTEFGLIALLYSRAEIIEEKIEKLKESPHGD